MDKLIVKAVGPKPSVEKYDLLGKPIDYNVQVIHE